MLPCAAGRGARPTATASACRVHLDRSLAIMTILLSNAPVGRADGDAAEKPVQGQAHRSFQRAAAESEGRSLAALMSFVDETRALFHRLRLAAEQLHRRGELSAGLRNILRDLNRLGPQTVPQMARARPVSRQHIQALVDRLAEEGSVAFMDNPAHERSRLVRLTPQGKQLVEAMNRREAEILGRLKINIPGRDLLKGAAVLRAVRQLFESDQWKRLVAKKR